MTEANVWRWVEQTGWFAFGRWKAVGSSTRSAILTRLNVVLKISSRGRVSYLDTRVQSQLWTSTRRSQSVGSTQVVLVSDTDEISTVLTGSKDGTMLLGEIEPGVSV